MAQYITDVLDIPELIGFVREQVFEGLTLDALLPNLEVDDFQYALTNLTAPNVQVAKYRAWDTPPPLGKRGGFADIKGEILPLGLTMRLNEKEFATLQRLRAGTPTVGNLASVLWDDALNCVHAAQARIEIARGDLLTDGKVTISENGVILEADFGVPGTNIVTAAIPWSTSATAVPLSSNLPAWLTVYRAANGGRNPDFFLTSSEVMANLAAVAEVRTLAPVTGVIPGIITQETVLQVFRAHGYSQPFITYDTELPNSSDVLTRVIGARKFIMARFGTLGRTLYGPTADALAMAGNGTIDMRDAPGVIAFSQEELRPAAAYTTGEAVALPILRDPRSLFVATV